MSATIFTHIETINKRAGSGVWRVITGAGIYDLKPDSAIAKAVDQAQYLGGRRVKLTVTVVGSASRITGIEPVDGQP